jgi:thioredoxin reductase
MANSAIGGAGSPTLPSPPGDYPVVVVGSGPGALQLCHELDSLKIRYAAISADPSPGGMFRRFPLYQRLLSITKPYAWTERRARPFEWYDWNSLLSEDPELSALMPTIMDGTSSFPSRAEMERNLATFAERARIPLRYGTSWQGTRRTDDGRFALATPAGEYTCRAAVFAIGMAEPWKPATPGIEHVPHYVETGPVESYAGQRIFTVGKQNSAFEIATALLPWARQIVMASPSPAKLSVIEHALTGVRARYLQPYEDAFLANGVFLLDMRIEAIERAGDGFRIRMRASADGRELTYEADAAIATTGFAVPLGDLPELGVATFAQGKMPALTPFWESVSVPGIFFAGTVSQAAGGLKKHGIPANSGAVHGHRYNARVLARHLARTAFGMKLDRPAIARDELVPFLAEQLTSAPELWNQRSYLARVVSMDQADGIRDEGIQPLAHFVDATGSDAYDAVAVTMEPTPDGRIHPAVYRRRRGSVAEHLLDDEPLNDFRGPAHARALESIIGV